MSLLHPVERTRRGIEKQTELLAATPAEPTTLFEATLRDYLFSEVWTRPGLDLRSRYLIAMSGAACSMDRPAVAAYARGALTNKELTLAELREAALHLAVYGGFSFGALFDAAVTDAADALGLPAVPFVPLRTEPWDPAVRHSEGQANFQSVMVFGGPPPVTAYFEGGIVNFVFGEMWMRPGLDERARRWITLVGVANSSCAIPIRSHTWSAMASGNATKDEMLEFVLQYAIHGGWPRGSVMQSTVLEMARKVEKGLAYDAAEE